MQTHDFTFSFFLFNVVHRSSLVLSLCVGGGGRGGHFKPVVVVVAVKTKRLPVSGFSIQVHKILCKQTHKQNAMGSLKFPLETNTHKNTCNLVYRSQ